MFFEKILDVLLNFLSDLLPFVIVRQEQEAGFFRLGLFKAIKGPGLHFKIPFADDYQIQSVVWTTLNLKPQTITTVDGYTVVIQADVKYKISNLKTLLLEVWDAENAIRDVIAGVVFEEVRTKTFDQCKVEDMCSVLTAKAKQEVKQWGVAVGKVTIATFGQIRTIRLITNEAINLTGNENSK